MELIFSSFVLTSLLLVGSFVDLLISASSRRSVYHEDVFSLDPNATQALEFAPAPAAEYDCAA
jgi:hypothetical protein